MNILELDSFNLADAVKFNDQLNPRIWQGTKMRPEVREKLLEIAADFKEFLGLGDLDVKDITVSGSNAAYTYTPQSDIDLHLVVDIPRADADEVYRELFDAKKYEYNDIHNIKIGGYDVELYVENANKPPVSKGVFSVLNNDWISIPRQRKATIDDDSVRSKYEDLKHRIEDAVKSNDTQRIDTLARKIKAYRQAGLDKHGELGSENLAYKMLRNQGYIKKLYDARAAARDAELSLAEQNKERKPFVYGFKSVEEDATLTPDGVNPTTCMFLNEKDTPNHTEIIFDFMKYAVHELGLHNVPTLKIKKDPQWSVIHKSFGRYRDDLGQIELAVGNRHIMDVLRTLAHELQHRKQDEREHMPPGAGATGSPYENEAHVVAGILMRNYADLHPEYFEDVPVSESASGYIPTAREKNDPRYAMALTVDIKPGQTGREANKLALDTDKQGKPALLMKSVNLRESDELADQLLNEYRLLEEQDLFEIKMSPTNLKAEAAKTGAQAGMEFEMIVPNVQANEEPEYEADYSSDQRSRSFSDIRDFFYDGDYNGRRDVDRLEEAIREQYEEWLYERLDDAWADQGEDYIRDYIEVNDEFDEEEANQEATNQLQAEYGDDITPEDFDKMLAAMVKEKFDEFAQEQWADQGRIYDRARDQFMDEMRDEYDDEGEWLDQNYPYMSDIQNNFDISWPYYTTGDEGDLDIESVADDFSNAVGMKTNWSSSYHGGRREPNAYVVEPDGSLNPDNDSDGGLEFVSPPMPIDEMIDQLNRVKAWADDRGCYTNKSTGLHINISVPNYDLAKLDYVKLAVLLGDKYILDQYGRSSNTYAKSALGKVQDLIRRDPSKGKELLDKMRGHMEDLATKAIHSGSTDKYTSINTKSGYIEFRSPGGDWLNENFDKIENTLMRFTVALSAAMDPAAYREEYLKKLYKLLEPVAEQTQNKDTVKYFSDYVAGKMPKAALRSFIKQAQLERKVKRGETGDQPMWWRVDRDGRGVPNTASIEVVATSKEEALQKARAEWNIPDGSTAMNKAEAYPLRPYDTSAVKAQVGAPQPVGQQSGGLYKIYDTRGGLIAGDEYGSDQEALERARYWALRRTIDVVVKNDQGQEIGRVSNAGEITPVGQQSTNQSQGNWGIWMTGENRFSRAPGQIDNSVLRRFPSREAAEAWIETTRAERPDMRTDIEVREIEPSQSLPNIFPDLPRQPAAQTPDQAQGGLVDVSSDNWSADFERRMSQPQGQFTGNWLILDPQGREIHRFGGIGNSQADANAHAIRWLQSNPRYMQAGVEVVPEMA